MNRNLDGTELTDEQLREFCREAGVTEKKMASLVDLHSPALIRSKMLSWSAGVRFEKTGRTLTLNTRNRFNSPELFGGKAH